MIFFLVGGCLETDGGAARAGADACREVAGLGRVLGSVVGFNVGGVVVAQIAGNGGSGSGTADVAGAIFLMVVLLMLGLGQPDKDGRQHSEHIGLDEADQNIYQQHKHREGYRNHGCAGGYGHAHTCEDEDEQRENQHYHMATHHIGEQTHGKRRRLGEEAEYLDYLHNGQRTLEPDGYIGPKDFLPVYLGAEYIGNQECKYC